MKQFVLFLCIIFLLSIAKSQTDKEILNQAKDLKKLKVEGNDTIGWKYGGINTVNFSQTNLSNWAAGGESSLSLLGMLDVFAKYKKNNLAWDNTFNIKYGVLKSGSNALKKNEDVFEITSKIGKKASKKWYYTGLITFKSQISPTKSDSGTIISDFLSPGYGIAAIGMDYKESDFSVFISPFTGKTTLVLNTELSDKGSFGLESGDIIKMELGAYFAAQIRKKIMKNVTIISKIELFNNFTDANKSNRKNIDINWENHISMKVNKYLSANIMTNLIYDHDIKIDFDRNGDGINETKSPATQFKEVFGLGFSYNF